MILYHGSNIEIKNPDLLHSRKNVDFGSGFYLTSLQDQAIKWCKKHITGVISEYEFDEKDLDKLKTLKFDSYSEEWLDFIVMCRNGSDNTDYDIVIGGIANDRVFNTIELFFDDLIDKNEAIKRLRYEKPNIQFCFRTNRALDSLHFIGSKKYGSE